MYVDVREARWKSYNARKKTYSVNYLKNIYSLYTCICEKYIWFVHRQKMFKNSRNLNILTTYGIIIQTIRSTRNFKRVKFPSIPPPESLAIYWSRCVRGRGFLWLAQKWKLPSWLASQPGKKRTKTNIFSRPSAGPEGVKKYPPPGGVI